MKTRIPHLGHTFLFLAIIVLSLVATEVVCFALPGHLHNLTDPRLQLIAEGVAYGVALLGAALVFPRLWQQPFASGISWRAGAARWWLVPAGLLLGFGFQAVESHLPLPKSLPMNALFADRRILPVLAVLAVAVAPVMEEVLFRGFVLPSLASGVDYLRLPKFELPEAAANTHERWRIQPSSTGALVASSVVTSLLFALIHAPQLGYTWLAVGLLAVVSLVLCAVRLRFRSVAASALVHASYNLSIFVSLAVVTGGFRHLDKLR